MEVLFNAVGSWQYPEALLLRGCLAALEAEGIRDAEISVTLLDDDRILELNKEYLGKDWPTDVVAFPLHSPGEPVLGDVYLGFEQARRQAEALQIPLEEELLRLVIHGTLHVLGYRHPDGDDRAESEMFRKQERLLTAVLEAEPG
ncbi:MAG: rRNA maturation RNase YbeY [Gemmatimonadetes bacterium]|nr:rRNA maturation RNase YbeY [Gemmatimonadota bacterium]NNM04462.1 rRNA maturation RNase YbeY [Gemmatimonadota bacterium]